MHCTLFNPRQDGKGRLPHSKGNRKQNQGKGPAEVEMVLPGLRKAMPRRKRLQVPHDLRVPPPPAPPDRGDARHLSGQLLPRTAPLILGITHPATLTHRYNTKRVLANQVYQEFIADRHHLHMNATHWDTLTDFVKHLGREGICHVDETPKGWFITWIDNSPKALERQAANQKRERQDMDDEQREQRMIQEQIERARLESSGSGLNSSGESSPEASELIRQDEKIKLNLSLKPVAAPAAAATATAVKPKPLAAIAMAKVGSGKKLSGLAALASKERPLDTGASAVDYDEGTGEKETEGVDERD
ncbi:domain of Kin17 curved DNA-binding protein-domain-containing protein [Jimgerdemannia flammicorona]|uniref:Domain of Kin17 curved DNA-binding protein-domain-containing protein n=1 Tax=Jimgerdemannia flammicorona TaxID=994334 RepID=A0A433DFT7_9FUNG|nr:domain of Kin17 curved DNA-binding protein-domain-containing protein [Jimgerdemannia flammicorona]